MVFPMRRLLWTLLSCAAACGDPPAPPTPPPGPAVLALGAGGGHACALWEDNSVRCWGDNRFGQLGLGDEVARGGQPEDLQAALPVVDLGAGTVVQLALGQYHTCARLAGGAVRCWGDNEYGQLGVPGAAEIGNEPNEMGSALADVELGQAAVSVSAGGSHTCALLAGGSVKCWGGNDFGQLGQGDALARGGAEGDMAALDAIDLAAAAVKQVVTGLDHTCALTVDGEVKCFGSAFFGNLGTGSTNDRGDAPGEMGEALAAVDLGTRNNVPVRVSSIAAANETTCALLEGGGLKCWGNNARGQLGIGSTEPRGARPGEMGNGLPAVDLGGLEIDELALGADHVCARVATGRLFCWGGGFHGETGQGDSEDLGDEPGELGAALAPVDLGVDRTVVTFATRANHSCAVLDNGGFKCWGDNQYGQLGLGDTDNRGDDDGEMGDSLPFVVAR